MPTDRVELEPAFLLHRRPYRESSVLAELLSHAHGRLALVAKGVRRRRSVLRATLQPFRPLLVSWVGSGELRTLTGAESTHSTEPLSGRALLSGFYVNELLLRLVHRHDPHPELFSAYAAVIDGLAGGANVEGVLRVFEKRLLDAIGYGLTLDREANTGTAVAPGKRYRFQPQHGAVADHGTSGAGLPVTGSTLLSLANEHLERPAELKEAKVLMRAVLATHLGAKPLFSRELFTSGTTGDRAASGRRQEAGRDRR